MEIDTIDIINNGPTAVGTTTTLVNPTLANNVNSTTSLIAAKGALDTATAGIKTNTTSWINTNYPALVYNSTKCERDIGFLLDALRFDLMFEGNTAIKEIANSYWNGITSVIPTQIKQHVAAFGFIRSIIDTIMRNTVFTVEQRKQVIVSQETIAEPTVSESLITRAQDLILLVEEVIDELLPEKLASRIQEFAEVKQYARDAEVVFQIKNVWKVSPWLFR